MYKIDIEKTQPRVAQDISNLTNGKHDGYIHPEFALKGAALTMKTLWNTIQHLQDESLKDRAYAELYQDMCDKYHDSLEALLKAFGKLQVENKRLEIENLVYKKTVNDLQAAETQILRTALELACESIRICPSCHIITAQPKPDNHWVEAFIQQAKEVIKHAEKENQ